MGFVRSELEGLDDLDAAALRLYRYGFDKVDLAIPTLGYEPRSSCQCSACAALWIGSKSGPVMRIDLRAGIERPAVGGPPRLGPRQSFLPGDVVARALCHFHACRALTRDGEPVDSVLIVGRDDGVLDIVRGGSLFHAAQPSQDRRTLGAGIHLHSWAQDRRAVPVDGHVRRTIMPADEYTVGITAIAKLEDPDQPDAISILVATRYPRLFVIRARGGTLELRGPIAMPGWIDWIIAEPGRASVLCISRGGDIAELPSAGLHEATLPRTTAINSLSLHPTAVLPFGERGLLIGTRRGLAIIEDPTAAPVAVPITRSPVLCMDRAVMPGPGGERQYVALGLEDGRIRVADAEVIHALAGGPPARDRHRFAIDLGDGEPVLALETMRVVAETAPPAIGIAFVLAIRRDHSIRLFKVAALDDQVQAAGAAWQREVARVAAASAPRGVDPFAVRVAAARALADADAAPELCDARNHLLVRMVLPELVGLADGDASRRQAVVDLAITIAATGDDRVQRALSLEMTRICDRNVDQLLRLSLAILRGMARFRRRSAVATDDPWSPAAVAPRWAEVVSDHLGRLHRLTREAEGYDSARGEASGDDRARLVAWARFVRKYVARGDTFAAKRMLLEPLVGENYRGSKYFDALIYHARLAHSRYDLRWDHVLGIEIAAIHLMSRPSLPSPARLIVVVTSSAGVRFVDAAGNPLLVHDDRAGHATPGHQIAPFADAVVRRTLASAVAPSQRGFRIVLAADGEALPCAGLVVIDVTLPGADSDGVRVQSVAHVQCTDPATRVHALAQLPATDVFVAGLESPDHPVGKLARVTEPDGSATWTLELAGAAHPSEGRASELASVAPGKVPTRALAVARGAGTRYLVVAGSNDGQIRAFSCTAGAPAARWQIDRWDQATDAITHLALGRHERSAPGAPAFSCYLSTSGAEMLALSIVEATSPSDATFGGYEAHPLWREAHDGTVVAMHMWRTPLYEGDTVLAVVTRQGRVVLYNHDRFDDAQVSANGSHWFRGKRLGRMTLPGPLITVATCDDDRSVVVAGPHGRRGGRLYTASLMFLRDSHDLAEPAHAPARAAVALSRPSHDEDPPGLPPTRDARLRYLLARSDLTWPFRPTPEQRAALELELWELVPIDAVSEYALRQRCDAWRGGDGPDPQAQARALLRHLDPDRPGEAARIKVILKSLCRAFLLRGRGEAIAAIRGEHWPHHEACAAVCERVLTYMTRELARATPATARLRIVAIKELLCVGVLHHVAKRDDDAHRIRSAVERALTSCLRDDDRIVRIEALRALSIMLRNVRVMAERSPGLIRALFPEGLTSITWALDRVVDSLARFPSSRNNGSGLVSGAWYRISVLSHVFRLFPDHTLALCDHVTRGRRSDDVVRQCDELLRRPSCRAEAEPEDKRGVREARIELYTLRVVQPDSLDGASALERYVNAATRRHALGLAAAGPSRPAASRAWHDVDDGELADRLLELAGVLSKMWSAGTAQQVSRVLADLRARPPSTSDTTYAWLPRRLAAAIEALLEFGDRLARAPRDRALARHSSDPPGGIRDDLPAGFARAITGILATWSNAFRDARPHTGQHLGRYELGAECYDDRTRQDFVVVPAQGHKAERIIVVLSDLDALGSARFLPGARLNQRLTFRPADGAADGHRRYLVEVSDVLDHPRPAYVMRKHEQWLEQALEELATGADRFAMCERVALHIARALDAVHAEPDGWHGAVKKANIAVVRIASQHEYRLGCFDRGYDRPHATSDATDRDGRVPDELLDHATGDPDSLAYRRWGDVASLLLLLYWMMTGRTVDPGRPDLERHLARLDELAQQAAVQERPQSQAILDLLRRLFLREPDVLTAAELVATLERRPPRRALPVTGAPRPVAVVHVGTGHRSDVINVQQEAEQIRIHLRSSVHGSRSPSPIACTGDPSSIADALGGAIAGSVEHDLLVHVSCHGRPEALHLGRLDDADAHITAHELVELLAQFGDRVRGVVLAACHAEQIAQQLAQHVEVVIFGSGLVRNDAAAAFTVLYRWLGDGNDVWHACARGNLEIRQQRRADDDRRRDIVGVTTPAAPAATQAFQVITRAGTDARTLRLFGPDEASPPDLRRAAGWRPADRS